jgi:PPOX class probable F420-dependent enzyme
MEDRVRAARVARLATIREDGGVDLVPITFAVDGDQLLTAVDHKPKSTRALRRLDNVRRNPAVTALMDHYDDHDWSALWWVRLRGTAHVVADGALFERAVEALVARYPQYREHRPQGPAIVVDIAEWTGWAAG